MIRIYLDDLRPTPTHLAVDRYNGAVPRTYTHRCYTAAEAMLLLATGQVEFISFDHDLGPETAGTGYDVARYIEEMVHEGIIPCPEWDVHSSNPVGARNINAAMRAAASWDERLNRSEA